MREVFTMWRETRMVMLAAVVAAVYAAVLIPFNLFTIIPGFTSIRPANVFPVIFGIAFGPAAAWGSAIGNLIADVFSGQLGPGSVGGFLGNFFFGLLGYKLWGNLGPLSAGVEPDFRQSAGRQVVEYVVIAASASALCAAIIATVVDVLGLVPFAVLGSVIVVNNGIAAIVLGPPLLYLVYPRLKGMGLLYPDLLRKEDLTAASRGRSRIAALALVVVSIGWLGVGLLISTGATSGTTIAVLGIVGLFATFACSAAAGERLSSLIEL